MKKFFRTVLAVVIVFVLIQFIPINRTNEPVQAAENFVQVMQTPPQVTALLKNACYDCHSNETVYPEYARVAPFSWSVKHHVNKGRRYANFSVWTSYNDELKMNMLKKSVQTLKDHTMPMPAYINFHPEASLNPGERELLISYFESLAAAP